MSGTDLQTLFTHDVPLIDVRAPAEFAHGAFPTAHNLPLLNDRERHQVGIVYKEGGQRAAMVLGSKLVRGDLKAARLKARCNFLTERPHAQLYCPRGGLRSQLSGEWIGEAGIRVRRVEGGYKAMRRFLLEQLERVTSASTIYVLSGRTGSGKTRGARKIL